MEAPECPLCLEDLDVTERNFHPCKCGYQVCLWCWHKINEKLKGKCPACRTDYDPQGFQFVAPDQESLQKEKQTKEREKTRMPTGTVTTALGLALRKDDVRVLQRNLCYVTGVPASLAKEDTLKKREYFGKFGRIVKVAVSRKPIAGQGSGCSAYVTYKRTQDAEKAIKAFNGLLLAEGPKPMKASFGTTKYCASFLRNTTCTKPNCLYLHETARPEDCYSREDLALVNATSVGLAEGSPHLTFSPASVSSLAGPAITGGFSLPAPASLTVEDSGKSSESTTSDVPSGEQEDNEKGARSTRAAPPGVSLPLALPPAVQQHYNQQRKPSEKREQTPPIGPMDPTVVPTKSLGSEQQSIQRQLKRLQLQQLHQQLTQPYQNPDHAQQQFQEEDGVEDDDQEIQDTFTELSQGVMSEAILLGSCPKWDFRDFIQLGDIMDGDAGEERPLFSIAGLGELSAPPRRASRYEFASEPEFPAIGALDDWTAPDSPWNPAFWTQAAASLAASLALASS